MREFNWPAPINVFAFGALTAVQVSGGQGSAYVGITEETVIDPNTGRGLNKSTSILGQAFPSPSLVDENVLGVTFAFGSAIPGGPNTIEYANANFNIFLWS